MKYQYKLYMDKVAVRKLWMPITKNASGQLVGILSDTSIDRDEEFMGKELIESWAVSDALPALADHKNSMINWVGGWKDRKVVRKKGHTALMATPIFFSKEANPLAAQIRKQVEEALEMGLNPGISIGAIPTDFEYVEIDEKEYRKWTKAELVEATWVPIQSNRNASFGHIAKSFDLNIKEGSLMSEDKDKDKKDKNTEDQKKMKEELDTKNAEIESLKKEIEALKKNDEGSGEGEGEGEGSGEGGSDESKSAIEELTKSVKSLTEDLSKMKKDFDAELEKKVKEHLVKLPPGPGTMDQDGQKKKKADDTKKEKEFDSEELLKAYLPGGEKDE